MDNQSFLNDILSNQSMQITEILMDNPLSCQIFLLGEIKIPDKEKEHLILKLVKKEFDNSLITSIESLKQICSEPSQYFSNDVYKKFLTTDNIQNKVNVELIYPASNKLIERHRQMKLEIITETYEMYLNKTLPYINSIDKKNIQWIYNALYHNTEEYIAKTDKFMIFRNYTNVENKNLVDCLGLPFNADDIRSLRDLNEKHLDLLEAFYDKGKKLIAQKFNCKTREIRAFIHYPPSFYYLHIHFIGISLLSYAALINRAIDLKEVITNIKIKNDYYQTVPLDHSVRVGSELYIQLTK